jgi:hypothetical protein
MFPFSELNDEEFMAMFPSNYDTNEHEVYFNGHWYPCQDDEVYDQDDEVYDTCLVDYPWA